MLQLFKAKGVQCKTSKESCQFDLRQYLRPQCLAWEGGKNAAPLWCATTIPDDSQALALLKTFCRMDRNSIFSFGVFLSAHFGDGEFQVTIPLLMKLVHTITWKM